MPSREPAPPRPRAAPVELLTTPDCPHAAAAEARVGEVVRRLLPDTEVRVQEVRTLDQARRLRFPGSPTVRIGGEDLEPEPPADPALACRTYGGEGLPPEWLLEAAALRGRRPSHVLFLCVANSARSQMAEGIARRLAPPGVRISSAGSSPTSVRPQAVRVLGEIGIDIGAQRSSGLDDVEGPVHAVITLCAEEVCPVWPGEAARVHWPLPDPAAVVEEEARLEAFRAVRDELLRRLRPLFRPDSG